MARLLAITPGYLSDLERGRRPFSDRLADAFLSWLDTIEDEKK